MRAKIIQRATTLTAAMQYTIFAQMTWKVRKWPQTLTNEKPYSFHALVFFHKLHGKKSYCDIGIGTAALMESLWQVA